MQTGEARIMHSPLRFLPSILTKSPPMHLTLFVTKRCNAKCPFCFYSGGRASERELTLPEYSAISENMGQLLWLAISGGEPLLRDDLVEIVNTFYVNNRPSIILIPTNGLRPEKTETLVTELLSRCPDSILAVKLSMDGDKELHDRLRGVQGAFESTMETYRRLAPMLGMFGNFELGVNTVFCKDNEDVMEGIISEVRGMQKIRTHTISLARGETREAQYQDVDLEKYLAAAESLARGLQDGSQPRYNFGGARIKAAQDVLQRRLIHETATKNSRRLECYAGRLNLVITETGELYPCESFMDEQQLGNVRENEYNITGMIKKEGAQHIIERIGRHCFCTHECYMMTNILFNPRLYGALLREYLSL